MAKDNSTKSQIERRVLSQMLADAFFTVPSAILIGFFIIATFLFPLTSIFPWWQNWLWIVVGVIAEAIYLGVTITDPVANRQAADRALREKFNPYSIKNISARQRLLKALDYKANIDSFVERQTGAMKLSLSSTASQIDNWIGLIYRLAKDIDTFEANQIIDRDRRAVPAELQDLKRRLTVETDPAIKTEIQTAIKIREELLGDLNTLSNNVKRTDLKIDNTLAQLSTVYAQMQLLGTGSQDSAGVQRLNTQIQDEIDSLRDTVSAMSDVYNYKGYQDSVANLDAEGTGNASTVSNTPNQQAQRGQRG